MPQIFSRLPNLREFETGRVVSGSELAERAARKAQALRQCGVLRGDRVVIAHGNSIEFFTDLFAVWGLASCAVPIHPSTHDEELTQILKLTQAGLVLSKKSRRLPAPVRVLHTTEDFTSPSQPLNLTWPSAGQECLILFSSGSSGGPKGVRHGWKGLDFRLGEIQRRFGSIPPKTTLCALPTSFGHGLIGNCLAPWLGGSELTLLGDFNPLAAPDFARILAAESIEFFSSVPSMWKLLMRCSPPPEMLTHLKRVHCASAPLDQRTHSFMRRFCGGAQTCNVYGLTETASWIAGTPLAGDLPHDGYLGEPWGAQAAILTEGRIHQEANVEGQIALRSASLMLGYLGGQTADIREGYFLTGDAGYLDSAGHITIKQRLLDEINRGGAKISPMEICACLEAHPDVECAWVTGVPDDLWGQSVGAMVVAKNGLSLAALKTWCLKHLSPLKQPVEWLMVEALPRLNNGKIDRKTIARALEESVAQRAARVDCQ